MSKHASRTSDGPELDPRVRALLAAASAPDDTAGPLPGEDEALTAFRTAPQPTRRMTTLRRRVSVKAAVAAAISTGVLLTGVGAAAAGVLPSTVQETVSEWLEPIGVSVPAGEGADENGDPRDRSEEAPGTRDDDDGDPRDRSEEAPGARDDDDGDPRDRSEEAPGARDDDDGDPRDRSEEAPGARDDDDGDQCGRSEEAPGARDDENGDPRDRSEEAPGARDDEIGDQCGRSEEAPGDGSGTPPTDNGGPPLSSPNSD
jgi:hypothetical protein